MQKIAILASGNGSNAQNIIEYFAVSQEITVKLVLSNNPKAFVIERSGRMGIPFSVFSRKEFYEQKTILELLISEQIDYLILAGFLWLVPDYLLNYFQGKILNIHPALLPKFGGKGMYGNKVHEAVIAQGERESGITIHEVNEHYDEGQVIFQSKCLVYSDDTPDTLATRIHELEHRYFPVTIERWIMAKCTGKKEA